MVDPVSKKKADDEQKDANVASADSAKKKNASFSVDDVFGGNPDVFADMAPTAFQPIDPETWKPIDHTEETQAPFLHDSVQETKELEEDIVTEIPQKENVLWDDSHSSQTKEDTSSSVKASDTFADWEVVSDTVDATVENDSIDPSWSPIISDPFVDSVEDSSEEVSTSTSSSDVQDPFVDSISDDSSTISSTEKISPEDSWSVDEDSSSAKEKNADYYDPFVDTVQEDANDNSSENALSQTNEDNEKEKEPAAIDTNIEEKHTKSLDAHEEVSEENKEEDSAEENEGQKEEDDNFHEDSSEVVDPFLRDDATTSDDWDSFAIDPLDVARQEDTTDDESISENETKESDQEDTPWDELPSDGDNNKDKDMDMEGWDNEIAKPVNEVQWLVDGFVDPFLLPNTNATEDTYEDEKKEDDVSSHKPLDQVDKDTEKENEDTENEEDKESIRINDDVSYEEEHTKETDQEEDTDDSDASWNVLDEDVDQKDWEEKTALHTKFITLCSLVDTADSFNDSDELRLVWSDNDALYVSYLFSKDHEAIVINKEATDRKKDSSVSHVMRLFINDATELELVIDDISLFTESSLADDDKSRIQVLDKLDKFIFLLEEFVKEKEKEQEEQKDKKQRSQAKSDFREF